MNEREPALVLLRGPVAESLIGSVLATLTSDKTKQAYATALADFLSWAAQRGEPLSKPLVEAWRGRCSPVVSRSRRSIKGSAPFGCSSGKRRNGGHSRPKKPCGSPQSRMSNKAANGSANG